MTEQADHAPPRSPSGGGGVIVIALIVVLAGAFGWWLISNSSSMHLDDRPLPVIARVPDFSLTERSGSTVTRADLLGKVWVADFVFTSCAGPCPEMSLRMRSLQETLKDTGRDVTLVTFTVDPTRDTPKVLARYAEKYGADPTRWLFLTGPDDQTIQDLVKKGFLQALAPATPDSPIIHSTRFVLIDRRGRIRAAPEGLDVSARDQLLHDLDKLLNEDAS